MEKLSVEIFCSTLAVKDIDARRLLETYGIKIDTSGFISEDYAFRALRLLANFYTIELKLA